MQLDHIQILRAYAGCFINTVGGGLGHVIADHLDHALLVEAAGKIRGHGLGCDIHRVADAVPGSEFIRAENGGARAAGRRAALEACQRIEDFLGGHDFFQRQHLAEQGIRILAGVAPRLLRDLAEGFAAGAVAPAVFASGAAEHLRRRWCAVEALGIQHHLGMLAHRIFPVIEFGTQCAALHFLETQRQHAFGQPAFDGLPRQEQRSGTGGAVVVDVDHGNAAQAEFVYRALAAGGIAVDIAGERLFDIGIGNAGVVEGQLAGFAGHFVVVRAAAGFGEPGHAHADHIYTPFHVGVLSRKWVVRAGRSGKSVRVPGGRRHPRAVRHADRAGAHRCRPGPAS